MVIVTWKKKMVSLRIYSACIKTSQGLNISSFSFLVVLLGDKMQMQVFGSSFQVHVKYTKCKWFGKVSHPSTWEKKKKRGIWLALTAWGG